VICTCSCLMVILGKIVGFLCNCIYPKAAFIFLTDSCMAVLGSQRGELIIMKETHRSSLELDLGT
jgi:uncharacterized membrane protein YeaQ/YmgE (transglycosylase-associated protein family)